MESKMGRSHRRKMTSRSRKRTISSKIKDFNSCSHCSMFKSKSLKRLQNHLALRHTIFQRTKSSSSISNLRNQKHQEEKKQKDKKQDVKHHQEKVTVQQESILDHIYVQHTASMCNINPFKPFFGDHLCVMIY